MRSILDSKGVQVLDIDAWASAGNQYDAISCLNLLDRCERPLTLLRQIKASLKPDGFLVVALVIPFRPYVEFGDKDRNHLPIEELPIHGKKIRGSNTVRRSTFQ